jgi:hypothetical protein
MKKNLLTAFFISVLVPGLFSSNSENGTNDRSIVICRDSVRHKTILKLTINNVKTDSILIDNVDFTFDSFIKMNDSVWHYIYLRYPRDRCTDIYNQLLIGTLSNKLHILLPCNYLYAGKPCKGALVYDSLLKKAIPVMIDSTYGMKLNCSSWEKLNTQTNSSDSMLLSLIKEIYGDTIQKIDSSNVEVYLRYDPQNQVYYNKIITLDSLYHFYFEQTPGAPISYVREFEENQIRFDHQKVYVVELPYQIYSFFYFKNQWFTLNRHGDRSVAPLEDVEIRFRISEAPAKR